MKTSAFLALFLGFASQVHAQVAVDPSVPGSSRRGLAVETVNFNGSGCPAGKETGTLVQGDILWLKFARAQKAEIGPNTSLSASRRNCAATIRFANNNKSYAVDSIASYIEADIPAQNSASVNVSWFFEGTGQTGSYSDTLEGDYAGIWLNNFDSIVSSELWSPCKADRALTVNSAIRISGPRNQPASANWPIIGIRFKARGC